jgi:hypothetical protein
VALTRAPPDAGSSALWPASARRHSAPRARPAPERRRSRGGQTMS